MAVLPLICWKKKIGRQVGETFFFYFSIFFFSRKEQGQACNFMKIQELTPPSSHLIM